MPGFDAELAQRTKELLAGAIVAIDRAERGIDYLDAMRYVRDLGLVREAMRTGLVRCARQEGVSWAVIGECLGMPRQQAWRTYKHLGPPEGPTPV